MTFLDDVFLLIGILLIIIPTFLWNITVGCYLLGLIFIVLSLLFAPKKEKEKPKGGNN